MDQLPPLRNHYRERAVITGAPLKIILTLFCSPSHPICLRRTQSSWPYLGPTSARGWQRHGHMVVHLGISPAADVVEPREKQSTVPVPSFAALQARYPNIMMAETTRAAGGLRCCFPCRAHLQSAVCSMQHASPSLFHRHSTASTGTTHQKQHPIRPSILLTHQPSCRANRCISSSSSLSAILTARLGPGDRIGSRCCRGRCFGHDLPPPAPTCARSNKGRLTKQQPP
ncbi:hypothetical protein B0J12DRAFT_191922 [Macrophomina phaseolina]|uniref:Uncharacterized protein n=1 Tax=Macrophomina phaseolina TaxID=35725 RepID=A0ABQ8G6E8_9PEZI|nr:hypothetical protein B0J12DRAFT_191922 [Macrophomina phaseolina]